MQSGKGHQMDKTIWLILAAGLGTFLMRYLPLHHSRERKISSQTESEWRWRAFITAIGPAAITALLISSLAPDLFNDHSLNMIATLSGVCAVVVIKRYSGGFAVATLAGALVYALIRTGFGF